MLACILPVWLSERMICMWHKKEKTIKKKWNRERKHTAVEKWTAYLAAGILFGGFCAALPLQAEEMLPSQTEPSFSLQAAKTDGEGGSYTQKTGTLSDNDVPPAAPDPEQTANQETTDADEGDTHNPDESAGDTSKIPCITSQPQDVCVEAGDCAYFSVSATGKNLTYQWFVDKGNGKYQKISGADESLYRVMVFDGSMNGYVYKCRVESGKGNGAEDNHVSNKENSKETNENYVESRAARLSISYKILGGARSVWVKSSGRGLIFQGSGAYSRFNGVNVDGSRITAGEYNKGGSQMPFTEVTLLRSYLETLAEGEHELEIVWSDGAAKTSFRIEPPATNLPADATGLGRTGTDTEGSSRAAGKTSAVKDAAAAAGAGNNENKDKMSSADREQGGKEADQISGNTTSASVSGNAVESSHGTAADALPPAGVLADLSEEEMTVTYGKRRTESLPSDFEKNPVRLAVMSKTPDSYARTICMAVILISAAGIAVGFLAYRLHDVEGKNKWVYGNPDKAERETVRK